MADHLEHANHRVERERDRIIADETAKAQARVDRARDALAQAEAEVVRLDVELAEVRDLMLVP